jgi:decaprenylphospho-beta-D-ribofuranose 2-oxidase
MIVSGWGRYPKINCNVSSPQTRGEIERVVAKGSTIARGGGRAYGDSAISAANTIEMRWFDQFSGFDAASGVLSVSTGVQLRDIIQIFLPRGWFLPVTPGTSFVTVGGAIASDVHGKNHHLVGTFGQHVREIELMLGSGEVVTASPAQHSDLFSATCGGMGLTGVILSAKIQLVPIQSGLMKQKTLKARNIDELFDLLEANSESPYSVAWVDCLATNEALGRSVLLLGEHAETGDLKIDMRQRLSVPIDAPSSLLNPWSVQAFNTLYYSKAKHGDERLVGLLDYFYPLDKVGSWNRLYGSAGFVQYQFVIPKQSGLENMRKILSRIADCGEGSFLAVIKLFGLENSNLLSFPFGGYTLALDFKISQKTVALLKTLDDMVAGMGGRIYLTKDALLSAETFQRMYPRWEAFEAVRQKYRAIGHFSSVQSIRLGLQ